MTDAAGGVVGTPSSLPIPDPTLLTAKSIKAAIKGERHRTEAVQAGERFRHDADVEKLHGAVNVILQRIDDSDIALRLLSEAVNKVPSETDLKTGQLGVLIEEKIKGVYAVLGEREKRTTEAAALADTALKAAFKAQQDAACVSADTPILCADLVWRPAGDLLPGDELLAFDEDTAQGSRGRRYRKATVTANSLQRAPLLRINTPRGAIRCTYDHPVLVKRGRGRAWLWTTAESLRPDMLVMHVLDVWDVDRSYNGGWMAGILDGEGCISFKQSVNNMARLTIGQVPGLVADKIDEAFKSLSIDTYRWMRPAIGVRQEQIRWQVDSRADIMRLLGSIRPARLMVHSDQIWDGFTVLGLSRSTATPVTSVESVGTGVIASLSTSTKTYIAGGFASHNTEQNKANEKAIAVSAEATAKTIAKNEQLATAGVSGLDTRFTELKDQVADLRADIRAVTSQRQGGNTAIAATISVIVAVAAVVGLVVTIVATR